MSRIQATFARLAAEGRKALIPYVTAGDPYADVTVELMHGMVEAGADVIELGVPFSDPMADGPVIQRASERALLKGISTADVLAMVRAFRAGDATTPVVLMVAVVAVVLLVEFAQLWRVAQLPVLPHDANLRHLLLYVHLELLLLWQLVGQIVRLDALALRRELPHQLSRQFAHG